MEAELRRLHSPDAPDVEHYVPIDADDFGLLLQAIIGPKDQIGEESFDFIVCTPNWLQKQVRDRGYLMGRHHLIVSRYDFDLIRDAIRTLCSETKGSDWDAIAEYLGRYGKWEFEDYRESTG